MSGTVKRLERAALLALLAAMLAVSWDYGVTFDEGGQQTYGEAVFNFFASWGKDRSSFTYSNLYLYGGLFDAIAVLFEKTFRDLDLWDARHMVNAFFAWIGYVYIWRLGKLLSGRLTAWVALVLLLLSPMYFSHMANNPKDIPFASAYIMALYYIIRTWQALPNLRMTALAKLILTIGFAINMRVGGLLLICYLEMMFALWIASDCAAKGRIDWHALRRPLLVAGLAPPLMILLGTLGWPWAQWQPLIRPFEALSKMSQFEWIGLLNFNGTRVMSNHLPWTYAPLWFAVTTPPVVLVGSVLGIISLRASKNRAELLFLGFAAIFPVAYVIYKDAVLYNGVRHLLFIYPPLVAIAACGLSWLYQAFASHCPRRQAGLGALFALLVSEPLAYCWRNHPNEGVYFNFLVGGTAGAYKNWDLDYWSNCAKQTMRWLVNLSETEHRTLRVGPYRVGDFQTRQFGKLGHLEFLGKSPNIDYEVVEFAWLTNDPQEREKVEQSPDVVYRVQADGAPLCYILKRRPALP